MRKLKDMQYRVMSKAEKEILIGEVVSPSNSVVLIKILVL
jgi:hypothetical protein